MSGKGIDAISYQDYYEGTRSGLAWWYGCYLGYHIEVGVMPEYTWGAILGMLALLFVINNPPYVVLGTMNDRINVRTLSINGTLAPSEWMKKTDFQSMVTKNTFITITAITLVIGTAFWLVTLP